MEAAEMVELPPFLPSRGDIRPTLLTPPKINIVRPVELQGLVVPKRQWIVPHWIPCGVVTGLYGGGGLGKSLLAQQLQTSAATGALWIGQPTEQCRSIGLYCEDDADELHRRQAAINAAYGCDFCELADMLFWARLGEDNRLMNFSSKGAETTELHRLLVEAAREFGARLVVVDTAADVFSGNENDRVQVREFVSRALGSLALAIGGAVVLCAHPSRSGMSPAGDGDGGSTAWSNTLRSRMYLTEPKAEDGEPVDPNARLLERKKANYATLRDEIKLLWKDGAFVVDVPKQPAVTAFGRRSSEDVFLDILAAFSREGQAVSASPNAGTFAPSLFGKRPRKEREEFRSLDFQRAMQALFSAGKIRIEEYGPPSKRRGKIVSVAA